MFCYFPHMRFTKYFAAIILFCACNTMEQNDDSGRIAINSANVFAPTDSVYLTRNTEITPANSYSDLFLDSIAVEQFIQARKLSADDEKSFRSFYNYRNLQFAWFSSSG